MQNSIGNNIREGIRFTSLRLHIEISRSFTRDIPFCNLTVINLDFISGDSVSLCIFFFVMEFLEDNPAAAVHYSWTLSRLPWSSRLWLPPNGTHDGMGSAR